MRPLLKLAEPLVAIALCAILASPSQAKSTTVTINDYQFSPAKLIVHAGEKVTWTNKDSMPHTATALDGKSFDSAALDPGADWSFVFAKKGDYYYRCAIHPDMRGEIVVE